MSDFWKFRVNYLTVFIVVMLADGMQGTHLYALYSEYNYNVASLYATGFIAGALSSPFLGPMVDKFGRRNSAIAYCALEVMINMMEQYNCLAGLILSRIIGGMTTNLLFTVFESWVLSEHRKKGFAEEEYDVILRDSSVASNVSAIASGVIAHYLAENFGSVGPFQGAVCCTGLALFLVSYFWDENYGCASPGEKNICEILRDGVNTVKSDTRILRLGLIMGLTEGTLQTFIYLWSPLLLHLTLQKNFDHTKAFFIDSEGNHEPLYGLIFGAFMMFGALGGIAQPYIVKKINSLLESRLVTEQLPLPDVSPIADSEDETSCGSQSADSDISFSDDESLSCASGDFRSTSANIQATLCFMLGSILLAAPVYIDESSFSLILLAFFGYEFLIGVYLPCEGTLRSIYFPDDEGCTLMTLLRVIVNVLVAFGVLMTNVIELKSAFILCSGALALAAILQSSLVTKSDWLKIVGCSSSTSVEKRCSVPKILIGAMEDSRLVKVKGE